MKKSILFDHDGVLVDNAYYQQYLRTEAIEIDGVVEVLAELSEYARMAIVTTSKGEDFELIHQERHIRQYMDFVLVREDYERAKPDPEPNVTALNRFGAARREALVVEDSSRGLRSAVAAGGEPQATACGFSSAGMT